MLRTADDSDELVLAVAVEELKGLVELWELVVIAPVKPGQPGDEDKRLLAGMDRKPSLVVCRWAESRCCCGCSS